MALPLPNLDDATFQELVDAAVRLAPQRAPAWTDHNEHDPGMTLIELFAWLTEMQRYHVNRITDASRLEFLKLLGIERLPEETLEKAQERARLELSARSIAVSDDDFEALALATPTPGRRVARAHALPLFAPAQPGQQVAGAVTVVVVPFGESGEPLPDAGFLEAVRRHLSRHRLITTRVYVVPPDYVRVGVETSVALAAGAVPSLVRQRISAALDRFLDPLSGGPGGDGWPFGRPVHVSEVNQVLEGVPGVDCVERVVLLPQRGAVERNDQGSLIIPPHSLVSAGDHRIEVRSREDGSRETGG